MGKHILGVSIVIMLLFLVSQNGETSIIPKTPLCAIALGALALYWACWVLYYAGIQHNFIIYAMVILPLPRCSQ